MATLNARFFAAKFKEDYCGEDDKAKAIRQEYYEKTIGLFKSLPYIVNYKGMMEGQELWPALSHGYHYGFIIEFESPEKMVFFDREEKAHLDFIDAADPYIGEKFVWDFPSINNKLVPNGA